MNELVNKCMVLQTTFMSKQLLLLLTTIPQELKLMVSKEWSDNHVAFFSPLKNILNLLFNISLRYKSWRVKYALN